MLLVRKGSQGLTFAVDTGSLRFTNGTVDISALCKGFMTVWHGGVIATRAWLPCGPVVASPLLIPAILDRSCQPAGGSMVTYLPPATAQTATYKTSFSMYVGHTTSKYLCQRGGPFVQWIWSGYGLRTCVTAQAACPLTSTAAGAITCAPSTSKQSVPLYGILILTALSAAVLIVLVIIVLKFRKPGAPRYFTKRFQ